MAEVHRKNDGAGIGRSWLEGVHQEGQNCYGHLRRRLNGARAEMEYRLKRHDGLWRWINDGVPTFDAEHRFTGYIGSCMVMDVTEKVGQLIDLAHYITLTSVFNETIWRF